MACQFDIGPLRLRQETGFQSMVSIRLKQEVSVLIKKKENKIPQGCSSVTVKLFNCCLPFCHRYALLIHGGKYFIKHLRARQLGSPLLPRPGCRSALPGRGTRVGSSFTEELHKLSVLSSTFHLETIFSSGLSDLIFHLFFFNQPPTSS